MPERALCIVLVVFASLPASAERLLFEGSFNSRTLCGKAEGCLDPVAIQPLPLSFSVDVNQVSSESRSVSAQWTPPRFAPTLLTQSTFESLSGGRVESIELQEVSAAPSGWIWRYAAGRQWSGAVSEDEQASIATYSEGRDLSVAGSRTSNGAVTFADLVATFDTYLAAGTPIAISQSSGLDVVSAEGIPLSGESEISTGSVRLTSITCRAPSRVGAMLAGAVKSLRGSS